MKFNYIVPASLALLSVVAAEEAHVVDNETTPVVHFAPTKIVAPFLEQFTTGWDQRWIPSHSKKVVDGVEDEDLLQYRGTWSVEDPTVVTIAGDRGLVVKDAAAHHAITAVFDEPIDSTNKAFVAQYEVKLQNGLECGGAYMKLLTADSSFDSGKFTDKTPFTIMFGPDKCGMTNKIHFIFRHKNPVTGEFEEKHLTSPPAAKTDKNTHLYTLIVNPDQSFRILVDNEEVKKGSLLTDFSPAVNPPQEIEDPEDHKPTTWVDEATIVDPEAVKPADWDEEAPLEILDEDAKKPSDWLDDAPASIPDPEAEKPEDWDDEEDGDWVAPTVSNPACEKASGCGEWKRPTKRNPDYKGKWKAPLVDNPAYKGVWAARKIPNPAYFEDKTPSNFEKIGAIGFEIWTMQNGILFDNVYVGHSAKDAKKLADESFVVKSKIEQKAEKAAEKVAEAAKPVKEKANAALDSISSFKDVALEKLNSFRDRFQVAGPVEAAKDHPLVVAGLLASILLPLLALSSLFGGGSKKPTKAVVAPGKKSAKASPVVKETITATPVVAADGTEGVLLTDTKTVEKPAVKRTNTKKTTE
ncbi:hypothetical protein HKX48_002935 [Thoreauomyces humboldtii]|nr:hypothetical protein HKX48_002935 [Thoreauomyces humboldtii]